MPMSQKQRMIVAGAIALSGMAVAYRAYTRSNPTGMEVVHKPTTQLVRDFVTGARFDTTPQILTLDVVLHDAAERAAATAGPTLRGLDAIPASATEDLVEAFRQRFEMTISGDYDQNIEYLRARGDTLSAELAERDRENWVRQSQETRLARVSLKDVETRVIYKRGTRVAPDAVELGFSTSTTAPNAGRFPVPADAEAGDLTVVEVQLPMEKRDVLTSQLRPTLVGYQFAWSDSRGMWIPWKNVIYSDPTDTHTAVFF